MTFAIALSAGAESDPRRNTQGGDRRGGGCSFLRQFRFHRSWPVSLTISASLEKGAENHLALRESRHLYPDRLARKCPWLMFVSCLRSEPLQARAELRC